MIKSSFPIAIIGMAFRFPGDISTEDELWNALKEGRDLITEIPPNRWAVKELQHAVRKEPGRSVTFSAGIISRIDEFDAAFFGISPREASWLDPQQRLLLELSWEAFENAGVPPSRLSGSDCAVYVGISSLDYGTRGLDDLASMTSHSMTGNTLSIAANRLSYNYDLRGPSLAVDTACSSSLVALHQACLAIQNGEANAALVGGVNLLLHPYPFVGFSKASMLSSDGRCKVFDAAGNGYVRSEGGAVVLLKPLEQAVIDGDYIQAVILATGVNADGARKTSITIPSSDGQSDLMKKVLTKTNLKPSDIDFVEAHGTGTKVGDPIEAAAIGAVYGQTRKKPLPIGSVKSNLGHMEAASGMAGLVKTIIALKRRALPPQIHLDTPNPQIDFANLNLAPVSTLQLLEKETPLVAGVNSFGFGGANSHIILKEYPAQSVELKISSSHSLPPLFISANSDAALKALANRYSTHLKNRSVSDYYDTAYGAAYRRDRLSLGLVLQADSPMDAIEKLADFSKGGTPNGLVIEERLPQSGGVAFVYSGNGSQWVGMGRRLLAEVPAFAEFMNELDTRIQAVAGFSILSELNCDEDASNFDDTVIAQPLLFAIQVAVTRFLKMKGIVPFAVAGHSVGEVAAAWACGSLSLDSAIQLIVARSRAQGATRGTGRMATVGLSFEAMQAVIAEMDEKLDISIAAINSPKNLTLSGGLSDLERVGSILTNRGFFFRLLQLDYAFHSHHMDPIREQLLGELSELETLPSTCSIFVSTITGRVFDGEKLDPEYWWRNIREPVRFSDAISALSDLGCRSFLEVGPNAILQRYISDCLSSIDVKARVLPSLRKDNDGHEAIREVVLRCYLLKEPADFSVFFPQPGRHVQLPNYPWQRERHWHPQTSESLFSIDRRRIHPLLGWRVSESAYTWENTIGTSEPAWLTDHRVGGAIVFPGSAYAEMALAAGHEWLGGGSNVIEQLEIVLPMVFDGEHSRTLRFELNERDGSFQIKSRQRLSNDQWTLHAAGRILQPSRTSHRTSINFQSSEAIKVERDKHYQRATAIGLDYGPSFRSLSSIRIAESSFEAVLEVSHDLNLSNYYIHPALLDVCFQSLIQFFGNNIDAGNGIAMLPIKIGRLEFLSDGVPKHLLGRLVRRGTHSLEAEFEIFDNNETLIANMSGCRFRSAPLIQKLDDDVSLWQVQSILTPHPSDGLFTELPYPKILIEALRPLMYANMDLRHRWFKEILPLFEALVVSFAFEAFRKIAEEDDDIFQDMAQTSDPFTRRLIDVLRNDALIFEDGKKWHLSDKDDLPLAEDLWRSIEKEHSIAFSSLIQLGRVGLNLKNLLLDKSRREEFVKELRHSPIIENQYRDDLAYSGIDNAIEHLNRTVMNEISKNRRLRILEIADGFIDVPSTFIDSIPEDRIDYVLAMPEFVGSRQILTYAAKSNVFISSIDLSNWQLETDEFSPEKFDIIILRHSLHRAINVKVALNQVRQLLAAGGLLLVAERYPDLSADFVAGLESSWWHQGVGGDLFQSSLVSPDTWLELLRSEGFEDAIDFSETAAEGIAGGAYLLLARAPLDWAPILPIPKKTNWIFLTDSNSASVASSLSIRLEAKGQKTKVTKELPQVHSELQHIVIMKGWNDEPETTSSLLSDVRRIIERISNNVGDLPQLWIVTQSGAISYGSSPGSYTSPSQGALWGFARVVMNEFPALKCTLIDHTSKAPLDLLEMELLHPDGSSEIQLSDQGRRTLILKELSDNQGRGVTTDERFRLDFHLPGQLRNLIWIPQEVPPLRDDAIEVKVMATGLNFRDVMYVMGLLPEEAIEKGFSGASLGLEFAGIVNRVGRDVQDFRPGEKVMGFGSACFASHVMTRADALTRIPDTWSFESAATVPTVFFTVYYALKHLANLQFGERVLIHGAAGGVGLAAIQLAKHMGAEVYATAGNDEKRDLIKLLGVEHIFDSRSLSFADDILAITGGEGVDVVLNSLSGEAIRRNLAALKPFGRFLELGKRDFIENTPIGLRYFRNNISYFGIDADQLLTDRPQLAARLFREVMELFHDEVLTPLPYRKFSTDRVVDAFRVMQQARHIGKVVVSYSATNPNIHFKPALKKSFKIKNDSTWIITGGLTGFGLDTARWLVKRGVKHLALIGRRGLDTPGAKESLNEFIKIGVHVEAISCDISDPQAVAAMIDYVRKCFPPIKGVLHAAAVFDDAPIIELNAERIDSVIAPKLLGAWNLHNATLGLPLDYFIVYSSVSVVLGNPGQANYVAANAGLENLISMRRQLGLPATCIAWGPIGDTGYLTGNETLKASLAQRLGRSPLNTQQALDKLEVLIARDESIIAANFEWNTLSRLLPSASFGRFSALNRNLNRNGQSGLKGDFRTQILGKPFEEVFDIIKMVLKTEISNILAIGEDCIDQNQNLYDLGLDSLMAVELAIGIENRFGIPLPVMMLNETPTIERITRIIIDRVNQNLDPTNVDENHIDETVMSMSQQHGEILDAETIKKIASDTQILQKHGAQFTS